MTKARDLATSGPSGGLVLIKPGSVVNGTDNGNGVISFSGASSVSLNDVFTSTYDNYRIIGHIETSVDTEVTFRIRTAGTDLTTSSYVYGRMTIGAGVSAAWNGVNNTAATGLTVLNVGSSNYGGFYLDVIGPNVAQRKVALGTSSGRISFWNAAQIQSTTQADGFTLYTPNTMTGVISVYGYKE